MSPKNESLTPYLEEMSPVNGSLSPEENSDLSTKSNISGDNGDTGDISNILEEDRDDKGNIRLVEPTNSNADHQIAYREPFYHCKQHPNVQNIRREEIEHHIQYSKEHVGE